MKTLTFLFVSIFCSISLAQTNFGVKFKITAPDGFTDETIVRLNADAEDSFDGAYDAWKWFTWNNDVPSIYSNSSNEEPLAINTHDFMQIDTSMFLWMRAMNTGGVFTMETEQLGGFPPNVKLALRDLENDNVYILDQNQTFSFDVTVSPNDFQRFELFYSAKAAADTSETSVLISNLGNSNWSYVLKDSIETEISFGEVLSESLLINDLQAGMYTAYVTDNYGLSDTLTFLIIENDSPEVEVEDLGEQSDRLEWIQESQNEASAGLTDDELKAKSFISFENGIKYLNYQTESDTPVQLSFYNFAGQLLMVQNIHSTELNHFEIPAEIENGIAFIQESNNQEVLKF